VYVSYFNFLILCADAHLISLAIVTVGSILGLQFFGKNHLFSFSEDGTIAIWKTGSWECLRTLRGHK